MKKYYLIILVFSLWAAPSLLMADIPPLRVIEPPDTLEGLKAVASKALSVFPNGFKAAVNEAKAFWSDLTNWFREWWGRNLANWLNNIWQKSKSLFTERKDIFKKELDGEKKEMGEDVKKEIPQLQKTFLEKLKEIIK
ncbi:hypothetical protein L6250_02850 [Candidatus Parcubacteria bacterium]|nr:hypothetical protein [Patescibacteria group bacterium]MBU4466472.1 hypothetical protein [Patescibacteria group bacterium]MCG2688546.1 hypothetical protein [Candidatus Parcubacteria bacterium]